VMDIFKSFTVVPAIDLRKGQVVRLAQGDFSRETMYHSDPAFVASQFDRQGARLLHVVDLDGARVGEPQNLDALRRIRAAVSCVLEVSGGLRSMKSLEKVFAAGADFVSLGSASVLAPELLEKAAREYPGRVFGSVDCRDGKVAIKGWKEEGSLSVFEVVKRLRDAGAAAIIYTDILRDGLEKGLDIAKLEGFASLAQIPVIVSGGVASLSDVRRARELFSRGVVGVIIGRALYEQRFTLSEALAIAQTSGQQSA